MSDFFFSSTRSITVSIDDGADEYVTLTVAEDDIGVECVLTYACAKDLANSLMAAVSLANSPDF